MTAILFDGFDHGDIAHRWTGFTASPGATTSPVRTGTHSCTLTSFGDLWLDFNSTEEDDTVYVGFGWFPGNSALTLEMFQMWEGWGTTNHLSLEVVGGSRAWRIKRGSFGATLFEVSPNVWFPNSWHYVEFGARIHDSTGWVELRQDGVTIGRFDGDTRNGGTDGFIDRVLWRQVTNGFGVIMDDVYILNEQGAVNNTWLGDTRCYPLYPNGNGTSSTPLSGSDGNSVDNYLLVDEPGAPVTTDYVFSSTAGDQDTYTFQDLPVTLGTIRGVEVRMHAAKSDTGTKQIRAITRRLSTDSFGPDHVLAAIPLYQTHHDIDELDPHAGPGAWTITNINSTEWGVEVRT